VTQSPFVRASKVVVAGLLFGVLAFAASVGLGLLFDLPPMMIFGPGFLAQRLVESLGANVTNRFGVAGTLVAWCVAMIAVVAWRERRRSNAA